MPRFSLKQCRSDRLASEIYDGAFDRFQNWDGGRALMEARVCSDDSRMRMLGPDFLKLPVLSARPD